MKITIRLATASLFAILMLQPSGVGAVTGQSKSGITLNPYIKELNLTSADTNASFNIQLTNNSGKDGLFKLSAVDFGGLNDSGGVLFGGVNESQLLKKYGLASWLELPDQQVSIKQGEVTTIPIRVRNDKTLSPGGHYAGILITPSFGPNNNGKVNVTQTISGLVLAIKRGGDVYDLRLNKISDDHSLFNRPSIVNLSFHNPGNVHVVPRGIVQLKQGEKVIAKGVINEESKYVLPESDRTLGLNLKNVSRPKLGLIWTKYDVSVDYRYDGFGTFANQHYQIRVINLWTIVPSVALLILVCLLWRKKSFRRRMFKYASGLFVWVKTRLSK